MRWQAAAGAERPPAAGLSTPTLAPQFDIARHVMGEGGRPAAPERNSRPGGMVCKSETSVEGDRNHKGASGTVAGLGCSRLQPPSGVEGQPEPEWMRAAGAALGWG
jgi:hypothetical protein